MRIAFLTQEFPCISNTFIFNQIVGLIDRGHDIDIFGRRIGNLNNVHADFYKYNLLRRMRHISIPRNYLCRTLKATLLLINPYTWNKATFNSLNFYKYGIRVASLTEFYTTLSFIKEKPYDIVHCQFGNFGIAALPLLQKGVINAKLVTSFRGADITKELELIPEAYNTLFEVGHLFLPVCQVFRKKLMQAGCPENKIRVHHSGIACDRFVFAHRYREKDKKTKILFVGRLVEKKGIQYALQAVARVLDLGRKISFTIIGDGPLRKELNQFVEAKGIGTHVHMLGEQPQEMVVNHLKSSHIFIAPCVTAKNNEQEGIPNVIKEAMATGMPVISTAHSGIPELVDDGISGFLVPEYDLDALVDRLTYLIDHPEIWPMMGEAGRNKIESEFNINVLNNELVDLYQCLLNGNLPTCGSKH
jgi:colanic acid/amylovoran biosynthesis glycosyltransferase